MKHYDIHKAAAVIIKDRKLLVVKEFDKDFYIAPGGTIHDGEEVLPALIRELQEELGIQITEADAVPFGSFEAQAAGEEEKWLLMDTFTIQNFSGELKPDSEIEALAWVSSTNPDNLKLGSIFEHDVIPKLKQQGLID